MSNVEETKGLGGSVAIYAVSVLYHKIDKPIYLLSLNRNIQESNSDIVFYPNSNMDFYGISESISVVLLYPILDL